jgi:hypothetical protein
MTIYVSNAFSLQMQGDFDASSTRISLGDARYLAGLATSCVGHADTAAVMSGLLGFDIPVNRVSISLQPDDLLVVGQYIGPRLPEGCTSLPDGASIKWYLVKCNDSSAY